jgi:hypothetical protein
VHVCTDSPHLRPSIFSSTERQRDIAMNTMEVAKYLVEPEGIPGNQLPRAAGQPGLRRDPYSFSLAEDDFPADPQTPAT